MTAARDLTSEIAYLTRALKAPTLRDAVSRLEAGGGVRKAEAAVDPDALAQAHLRYAVERAVSYTHLRS